MKRIEQFTRQRNRAGFTLTELLAVIVILGILATLLVGALGGSEEVVREKLTRAKLAAIESACQSYERRFGDFPPSRIQSADGTTSAAPNALNLGGEALVAALFSQGFEAGGGLSPDELVNVDADRSTERLTDFPDSQLFEFVDAWDNPVAYFRSDDYGREDPYLVVDNTDGFELESRVKPLRNPTTKRYFEHGRFQLISAGSDGVFGTEDDIANFARP